MIHVSQAFVLFLIGLMFYHIPLEPEWLSIPLAAIGVAVGYRTFERDNQKNIL